MPRRKALRVLVVDDEKPARQRLSEVLSRDPDVETVLEASDGRMAVTMIRTEVPDLVFLDMQMPELTGLGVIDEIGVECMPITVFVTAYDQHAISAFEVNALDYVLKPVGDARLAIALERAKNRISDSDAHDFARNVLRMMSGAQDPERRLERFVVKSRRGIELIPVRTIDWIEASGVYVTLHAGSKKHLYRATLHEVEALLDPASFVRVHRSALVNIESIVSLIPESHGEFEITLKGGPGPRVSRTYRRLLEERLRQPL